MKKLAPHWVIHTMDAIHGAKFVKKYYTVSFFLRSRVENGFEWVMRVNQIENHPSLNHVNWCYIIKRKYCARQQKSRWVLSTTARTTMDDTCNMKREQWHNQNADVIRQLVCTADSITLQESVSSVIYHQGLSDWEEKRFWRYSKLLGIFPKKPWISQLKHGVGFWMKLGLETVIGVPCSNPGWVHCFRFWKNGKAMNLSLLLSIYGLNKKNSPRTTVN